ncbi:unnamed protein product [Fraxinus pennsylvanica]|uniref:EF-hand domain-containing protein n=1 Tax=Fraxinus pennsylvanica TaxID=56036 RepID=A0AAD1Z307_9LAMI|nr:unnamed protein product [Fraxinus pennsylvanica]
MGNSFQVDMNGKGTTDCGDFLPFHSIYKGWPMMSIFTRIFPISTDGNGHIEPDELQDSLMEDGAHDCANVAKDIFQEVDSDKDGRISRDEFVAMMKMARTGERLLGIT